MNNELEIRSNVACLVIALHLFLGSEENHESPELEHSTSVIWSTMFKFYILKIQDKSYAVLDI